jgi:dTDP-L-rhamnose 4-epimerase
MTKILITGGAGFIGSQVALKLLDQGHDVTVFDNLSPQIYGDTPEETYTFGRIKNRVNFLRGDVRNTREWQEALTGQEAVLHLAAETGTGQSMYQIEHYTGVNIQGTALFLDALVNQPHTIQKVVVASSRSVYGEGKYQCAEHGVVYPNTRSSDRMAEGKFEPTCPRCRQATTPLATDEASQLKPASVYAVSKLSQEQLVLSVCQAINIPAIALRYQNVYGPGQSLLNPYTGILSIFSTALLNGKPINIFEDGHESRDFVYVEDVAEATVRALHYPEQYWGVMNVGSGVATSVLEVVRALGQSYGVATDYHISGNFRVGDIRHNFADITKLHSVLEFTPQWTFREGIEQFAQWVKAEHQSKALETGSYQQSLEEMRQKGLLK